MSRFLVNQQVSGYTKNDTIFEGIIKVRTDGKPVVTNGKSWCYLEDLKVVKPVGRLVEESIADSFSSVFKPIDFQNKIKSDRDEEKAIKAAIDIVKNTNKDAINQSDEDLESIAKDSFASLKTKSSIDSGDTTETKEQEKILDELSFDDPEEKDKAIADNTLTEDSLIDYFNKKRKAIGKIMKEAEIKAMKEFSYVDDDYGMTPENLVKAKDFINNEIDFAFDDISQKVAEDFNSSLDDAQNLVVDVMSDNSLKDSLVDYDITKKENEIESIIDDFYNEDPEEYGNMDNLLLYITERLEIPEHIVEKLLNECDGDSSEAICRLSEIM